MIKDAVPRLAPVVRQQVRKALSAIGYLDEWVHDSYEYVDLSREGLRTQAIELAAFAQYPPSYRDACIGVMQSAGEADANLVERHRALGAPLIFEVSGDVVRPWSVRAEGLPSRFGPEFHLANLPNVFEDNRNHWSPSTIRKARSPSKGTLQLDFLDALLLPRLASEFQARLKFLLEESVGEVKRKFSAVHRAEAPAEYLFPFLFRFLMAKVFRDRNDVPGWSSDDPKTLFEVAEKHCRSGLMDVLPHYFLHPTILEAAWQAISTNLHFQNFSLPDLFFIYESCFIDRQTRRELGVHNTPLEVADFVIAQLPVELLDVSHRQVIEPFCGSGVFLAAAMKRLSELMPDASIDERHIYLKENLVGVEKESLAIEVCRLVLTLVDYPNPNGWRLYPHDVFEWPDFHEHLKQSNIVLANPPFEEFTEDQRHRYQSRKTGPPAEFLRRILAHPPDMFGVVLPRSFVSGPDYREANRSIAENYGEVRTIELPENTFHYARVPTVLAMAYDRRKSGTTVSLQSSTVDKSTLSEFYIDWRVSESQQETRLIPSSGQPFSVWVSPRRELWEELRSFSVLGAVCEIHKGLNWKARPGGPIRGLFRKDVVRDRPSDGFVAGCDKMNGCLLQFRIGQTRYLSVRDIDQDPSTRANKRPWDLPKAVCNAARSAEPWRLRAYADARGLAFSKQYFALWPQNGVSIFSIAAVLCNPIASLFCLERDRGRDNRIETLREIPIPALELLQRGATIDLLSQRLHSILAESDLLSSINGTLARKACLELDAAILNAYNLNAKHQREVLDRFQAKARPIGFEFDHYFPDHFKEPITLSDFLAIQYDWEKHDLRRKELIEIEFQDRLSASQLEELNSLQRLAYLHTSLVSPVPLLQVKAIRDDVLKIAAE